MNDLRLAELICSRLCHDLVSPLGAIQNGLELIEDVGPDVVDDALALMDQSSRRASVLLQVFRMAIGGAGDDPSIRLQAIRDLSDRYLADTKIAADWQIAEPNIPPKPLLPKAALNLVLIGREALHFGGRLVFNSPEGGSHVTLRAQGRDASLTPDLRAALDHRLALDDVTARTAQAYFFGRWCAENGLSLSTDGPADDTLYFTIAA